MEGEIQIIEKDMSPRDTRAIASKIIIFFPKDAPQYLKKLLLFHELAELYTDSHFWAWILEILFFPRASFRFRWAHDKLSILVLIAMISIPLFVLLFFPWWFSFIYVGGLGILIAWSVYQNRRVIREAIDFAKGIMGEFEEGQRTFFIEVE